MKTKKSVLILGLVAIAAIAAGTVIGVNLTDGKQKTPQTPMTFFLTGDDHEKIVSLKTGDIVNLTLPDYGDGGYIWTVVQLDDQYIRQTDSFTWGSSGMLGDFGKDTWLFTALSSGSTTLELRCQRPFGENDVCETFLVTITII